MSTLYTVQISAGDIRQPVVDGDKTGSALRLAELFKKLASGHQGGVEVTARNSAAHASGTVTAAAVQDNDTVTINGVELTATQHHARGTITPTLSGIDLDDTVTIGGQALTAKYHHAWGFVAITAAGVDVDDEVVINGVTFVAKAAEDTGAGEFDTSGTDTQAATSLAACINASTDEDIDGVIEAWSVAGTCYFRTIATGTSGNAFELTSTDAQLAVSGATFTDGSVPAADEFNLVGTTAEVCQSILDAIEANATISALVTGKTSATVVTIRAIAAGTGGNAITLVSSDAQLAVSGAGTLTGGAAVADDEYDFGGTDAETAEALAGCINSNADLDGVVTAEADGAEVTITAVVPGLVGNYLTLASIDNTRLEVSGARLEGGDETEVTLSF